MPKCVIRVSPVGSDVDSVTHYVLEIAAMDHAGVRSGAHRTGGETIEVMG